MANTSAASLGPLTRAALRAPVEGRRRHALLVTIAAFQDAGRTPYARDLLAACPVAGSNKKYDPAKPLRADFKSFDALLGALQRDGWLKVSRAKRTVNGYTLNLTANAA